MDRIVLQALVTPALGKRTRQHSASGTVDVLDRHFEDHGLAVFERRQRLLDQLAVENVIDRVLLALGPEGRFLGSLDLVEDAAEIQPLGLPVRQHLILFEQLRSADDLVQLGDAKRGKDFAHFFGHEEEIVDDMFRRALEALAQNRVLRGNAHRAGIEMALAHHDAARRNQRRGGKAEFIRTEQSADDDIAAGLQAAIHLQSDARAKAVQHQGLLGFGKADFPWGTSVLQRGERRCAGAAIKTGNGDMVGARLGNTGRNRADADFRHQLHRNIGFRVDVLQIVDQLRQIFDGIDVVVRRRRDEADARRRMPGLGNRCIHLVAGQLTALAGLCTLRHLDLQHVGIDEIFRRHTKAARGNLLDGRAFRVRLAVEQRQVAVGFFATFAGVRLAADAVHGNRKRGMRLTADRTEGHGPGREPLDDISRRLDIVDGNRLAAERFR
ncbi:hypothetical protein D3C80_1051870 [compost metagenome]